jgi:hypothetical protein
MHDYTVFDQPSANGGENGYFRYNHPECVFSILTGIAIA